MRSAGSPGGAPGRLVDATSTEGDISASITPGSSQKRSNQRSGLIASASFPFATSMAISHIRHGQDGLFQQPYSFLRPMRRFSFLLSMSAMDRPFANQLCSSLSHRRRFRAHCTRTPCHRVFVVAGHRLGRQRRQVTDQRGASLPSSESDGRWSQRVPEAEHLLVLEPFADRRRHTCFHQYRSVTLQPRESPYVFRNFDSRLLLDDDYGWPELRVCSVVGVDLEARSCG